VEPKVIDGVTSFVQVILHGFILPYEPKYGEIISLPFIPALSGGDFPAGKVKKPGSKTQLES
jgi:hypothetical protein